MASIRLAYKSLAELVFESLRSDILLGNLRPGQRIAGAAIGERLGVSISPVRDALKRLEAAGLVRILPRKGSIVSEFSLNQVEELVSIRGVLEGYAARLASERIRPPEVAALRESLQEMRDARQKGDFLRWLELNERFHLSVWRIAGNLQLVEILQQVWARALRIRGMLMEREDHAAYMRARDEEHQMILRALAHRRSSQTERLVRTHTLNAVGKLFAVPGQDQR